MVKLRKPTKEELERCVMVHNGICPDCGNKKGKPVFLDVTAKDGCRSYSYECPCGMIYADSGFFNFGCNHLNEFETKGRIISDVETISSKGGPPEFQPMTRPEK